MAQLSPFSPSVPTLHVLMMAANGGSLADWIAARAGDNESDDTPSASPRVHRLKAEFRQRRAAAARRGGEAPRARAGVHLLREDEIVQLMRDITRGLGFLHDKGILHLDIKVRCDADAAGQRAPALGRRRALVRIARSPDPRRC